MSPKDDKFVPEIRSRLRQENKQSVPKVIRNASGISIYGRRIKSLLYTTDVATICYTDADAVFAVYPHTPHPAIIESIANVASVPVFAGVGGGITSGPRCANIAQFAEAKGATAIVLNAPTSLETIELVETEVEAPIVNTIVSAEADIEAKLKAGVDIFNVAAGKDTLKVLRELRKNHPKLPIIATGGKTEESIKATIDAGANAIIWTPPSNQELLKDLMRSYR